MSDLRIDVLVSGIRQMTSMVICSSGRCLLVDPGYFPREIADLGDLVGAHGRVKALVLTHGHWDRIPGHLHFDDVPIWVSEVLVQDIAQGGEMSTAALKESRKFDSCWCVRRPKSCNWSEYVRGHTDGERRRVGEITVQMLLTPGHSPDGMALLINEAGVLVTGDYLSPCQIPIVDDFDSYYRTLHRFADFLSQGVREVIPGHGWRMSAREASNIAREDLAYLYQLMFFRDSGDLQAAHQMMLPRLNEEEVIRKHHMENCRKIEWDKLQV
jgi:glyoxylase-like metal-dependent hydrolase (beta-lactamase superfamily II)